MKTKILKLESDADYWNAIREAAAVIVHGGLVIFPTETVYGVGCNAVAPRGLTRLREVKERPDHQPFTVHIGSKSAVNRFVPTISGLGQRLIEKAWPGPLTLIFSVPDPDQAAVIQETSPDNKPAMYYEHSIGIRYPDDRMAADLLNEAKVPVVAASANPAGTPAPIDADEAAAALVGQVDLILDGGRCRYARPSTIVQVNGNQIEVLREGVLDERTVRRLTQVHFLLVCSGNTCRSPMAAGLLRKLLAEKIGCPPEELPDRGYHVESAGTSAMDGAAVSPEAVRVLRKWNVDIADHQSHALTIDQIHRADYIFTMTRGHRDTIIAMSGSAAERTLPLADNDILDPIGGDEQVYEACAADIEQALRRRLEEVSL